MDSSTGVGVVDAPPAAADAGEEIPVLPIDHKVFVYKINRIALCAASDYATNSATRPLQTCRHPLYDEIIEVQTEPFMLEVEGCEAAPYFVGSIRPSSAQGGTVRKIPRIENVIACCVPSMNYFDPIIRDFICHRYAFQSRSVAVQAVAGSGKTEFLLQISKNHQADPKRQKRVLYLAFNKALVTGIRSKQKQRGLSNLDPMTFDSLIYGAARSRCEDMALTDLTIPALSNIYERFGKVPFPTKKKIIKQFSQFCQQAQYSTLKDMYPSMPDWDIAHQMWADTVAGRLLTFDGLRKLALEKRWMREVIDARYDMVLVDEAQDFDPVMLEILLRDTTVPKVFVGDPNQQIYEWRGTVNCFEHLPENTLQLKFYSTFRMGGEGVKQIASMTKTHMIAAPTCTRETRVFVDEPPPRGEPYTYIFRTWKGLLLTAQRCVECPIWIHEYDKKIASIERLHEKLQKRKLTAEEMQEYQDDDLPAFLMKLSREDLQTLKADLEAKSAKRVQDAQYKFSTIHSFKGMEDDSIRLFGDIDSDAEPKLYYVAMTRAKHNLYVDRPVDAVDEYVNPAALKRKKSSRRTTTCGLNRGPMCKPPPSTGATATAAGEAAINTATPAINTATPAINTPFHKAMREWRKDKANELKRPAFTILYDRTINDLAEQCPLTNEQLLHINGIGEHKIDAFGKDILALCRAHLEK